MAAQVLHHLVCHPKLSYLTPNRSIVLPEYIIQLVCVRDFNASNCTSTANIREANRYIVNMSILNNVGALITIGPMIYFAANFGRKPVYAVVLFGLIVDQLGLGLARTPLYVEIIHGSVGILVSADTPQLTHAFEYLSRNMRPQTAIHHIQQCICLRACRATHTLCMPWLSA